MDGSQPIIKLNSGYDMPILGFGTFLAKPGEVGAAVRTALKVGYRHIDCAYIYKNEDEVGKVFQEFFSDPKSGIKREDVFVTSKLWNLHHKKEDVKPAVLQTLKDLQLDYLDLYLIHLPVAQEKTDDGSVKVISVPLQETWQAMEKLVEEGLVRSIGISNFNTVLVYDLLSYAKIPPAVNQIERHPYLVQDAHVKWLKSKGIQITAYAPLGSPSFTKNNILVDPAVEKIAKKYNKSPAQVLIRWSIDDGVIVIPKSVTESRIKENFNVLDFKLSDEDMKTLTGLDKNLRLFLQDWTGVPIFS